MENHTSIHILPLRFRDVAIVGKRLGIRFTEATKILVIHDDGGSPVHQFHIRLVA